MAEPAGRKRRIAPWFFYALFALAVYVGALVWLFPYPEISRMLENRARSEGLALEIEGLRPGWFLGLQARRVRAVPSEQPDLGVELSEARLRLLPVRWVLGERTVRLEGNTMGGVVDALYQLDGPPVVRAKWDDVDLSLLPSHPNTEGLPIVGRSSGNLEAEIEQENPERITGQLSATITALKLGAGKVKGIPVPEVDLGDGTVRVASEEGKVDIETLTFEGGDLGIDFNGNILLRKDLPRSVINGMLSVLPSEKAAKDLALVFAVFPSSKSSDGRYTARVRGSLGQPRLLKR